MHWKFKKCEVPSMQTCREQMDNTPGVERSVWQRSSLQQTGFGCFSNCGSIVYATLSMAISSIHHSIKTSFIRLDLKTEMKLNVLFLVMCVGMALASPPLASTGPNITTPLCEHIKFLCETLLLPTIKSDTDDGCERICYVPRRNRSYPLLHTRPSARRKEPYMWAIAGDRCDDSTDSTRRKLPCGRASGIRGWHCFPYSVKVNFGHVLRETSASVCSDGATFLLFWIEIFVLGYHYLSSSDIDFHMN